MIINELFLSLIGQRGVASVGTGQGVVTGQFYNIYFPEAGIIGSLSSNITGAPLTGKTYSAGTMIPGVITSISMTSGTVVLLNK